MPLDAPKPDNEEICENIAMGDSVLQACEKAGISDKAFYKRLIRDDKAVELYMRARATRAHARHESVDAIKEELRLGLIDPNTARVLLDAVKWQSGKENAKVYGDSTILRGDKENPLDIGLAALLDSAGTRRATLPAIEGEAIHEGNTGQLTHIAKPE